MTNSTAVKGGKSCPLNSLTPPYKHPLNRNTSLLWSTTVFFFWGKTHTLTLDSTHIQKLLIYLTKTVYDDDTPKTYDIKKPTINQPPRCKHFGGNFLLQNNYE